jgi:hypothetical protein
MWGGVASGDDEATVRAEARRTVAKRQNLRATLLALLGEHLAAFALAGDTEAARIARWP